MNGKEDGNEDQDLDNVMTELMKAHLDDVTGAAASHNSWGKENAVRPTP